MAVRRFNANLGEFLTLAVGGTAGINTGAFTLVALVRKEADGGFFPIVSAETGASSRRSLWANGANQVMSNTGGFNLNTPVPFTQADGWAVVAVTKPAGDQLTRGHKGVLGGTWTHIDGDQGFDDAGAVDNLKIGSWQGGAFWPGLVAAVALYEAELSDATLEAGFTTTANAWLDAGPSGMWLLNQTSTGIAVLDVTGNGADQAAISGTTVELGGDPPGFNFTVGAATVQLTPAVLDLAPVALSPSALATSPGVLVASTSRPTLLAARSRPLLVATTRVGIPAAPALLNALSNPSLFGWPDASNTGVPASANLTEVGPQIITTPGAVVEDLQIDATGNGLGIEVRAPDVVIRRCRIITIPQAGGGAVKQVNLATGMVITFCELLYDGPGSYDAVVGESDYTIERCSIHHVSEGLRIGANTTVRRNYIRNLEVDDSDAHADAVQSVGGGNILIERNTVVANSVGSDFANAALIIGSEFAAANGIEVVENLLDGGGFTFFLGPSGSFGMSSVTVTGNRFGRAADFGPTSVGAGIANLTWTGNVFDDSNDEVPAV